MKTYIWVIVAVVVIIIIAVAYNADSKRKALAATAIADIAANTPPPPCVPFTKADQDAQKKQLDKDCAKLQFTPIIGAPQFLYCLGQVSKKLTPIKEC